MTKKKKNSKIKIFIWFIIFCGIIAGTIYANIYFNKYKKNVAKKSILYIRPGATYSEVIDSLSNKLIDIKSFLKVAENEGVPSKFSPGRYELNELTTNIKLARSIKYGYQSPMMLTISGYIRTPEILAAKLSKKLSADSLDFITTFKEDKILDTLGVNYANLLTLIIPDSYEVYWTISPEDFIKKMKKEYEKFWTEERREKASKINLTPQEVSILASIVYSESKYVPEYPNIASVYLNRLKSNWRLCADPTVIFATGDFTINRVLKRHLATDSPYNTYLNYGLPPGPISIATKEAIDGVLNPAETKYMFFCANPKFNGSHLFAETGAEHERNARRYRTALDSLLKARKAANKQ